MGGFYPDYVLRHNSIQNRHLCGGRRGLDTAERSESRISTHSNYKTTGHALNNHE